MHILGLPVDGLVLTFLTIWGLVIIQRGSNQSQLSLLQETNNLALAYFFILSNICLKLAALLPILLSLSG